MTRYVCNPVEVEAFRITEILEKGNTGMLVLLENGMEYHIDRDKTVRLIPAEGDYVVMTSDGYEYVNPKAVFEAKYTKIS